MMITMSMFKIYGVHKGRFYVDKQGRSVKKDCIMGNVKGTMDEKF